jgi:DNA polymerase
MHHCHVLSPANGPLDADVLFVAEAPGRLGAARTGVPMTSDATGHRFEAFLGEAGLHRARVFVTNAVLCNPLTPGGLNRRPSRAEILACSRFLRRQFELVPAPLVVALGGVALEALGLIEPHGLALARDVGREVAWGGRTLVALYHPGIRSTVARAHAQQLDDWRALGASVRPALQATGAGAGT